MSMSGSRAHLSLRPHEPTGDSASAFARSFGRVRRDDPFSMHSINSRAVAEKPKTWSQLEASLPAGGFELHRHVGASRISRGAPSQRPFGETPKMMSDPNPIPSSQLRTISGSGLGCSLSRPQSIASPLFRPSTSMGATFTHSPHVSARARRVEDAAKLRPCQTAKFGPHEPMARPETADESYASAKVYLQSRGIGLLNRPSQIPPWTMYPPKIVAGCSGILGI